MSDYLNLPKADYFSNLIAKWVFDDTDTSKVNGTTIYDQSGNGNNLTSANVAYVDDDDLGRCAYFNGLSSYCSSSTMKIPTGKKTVIIKFKTIINNAFQYFINSSDGNAFGHDIYIDSTNKIICGHRYRVSVSSNTIVETNKPITFKYSYDGSTIKIFMDNLTDLEASINTTKDTANNTNYFNVGRAYSNGYSDYYFKGYIQSIEIYNEVVEHINNAYLIKDGNKCYSFKNDEYISPYYNEITETLSKDIFYDKGQWNINKLFTETTIGSETFRPIDKFNNPQIVSYIQKDLKIQGIKNDKELIISNQNLSIVNAETIHNFLFDINKVANGNCKFVISADNGLTWLSWNGSSWISLTNTAPLDENNKIKQYSKLSDSEKNQWNKLRDEIWTSGMSTDITDVDYNSILTNKTIRFAFVLYRPTYDDNVTLKDTKWLYDKVGSWHKLSEDDIDIAINSNMCTVTPKLQNLEHVKVNILL